GYLAGRRDPALLGRPSGHGDADEDDTETAVPQTGLRRRVIKALAIWLIPVGLLLLAGGFVAQLTGFFTLAALITFGGAYAVLPYVASAAVNHYGWLTSRDMVAGLALGESTPGPLIMVNTFVGFVAAYNVEAAWPGDCWEPPSPRCAPSCRRSSSSSAAHRSSTASATPARSPTPSTGSPSPSSA